FGASAGFAASAGLAAAAGWAAAAADAVVAAGAAAGAAGLAASAGFGASAGLAGAEVAAGAGALGAHAASREIAASPTDVPRNLRRVTWHHCRVMGRVMAVPPSARIRSMMATPPYRRPGTSQRQRAAGKPSSV